MSKLERRQRITLQRAIAARGSRLDKKKEEEVYNDLIEFFVESLDKAVKTTNVRNKRKSGHLASELSALVDLKAQLVTRCSSYKNVPKKLGNLITRYNLRG